MKKIRNFLLCFLTIVLSYYFLKDFLGSKNVIKELVFNNYETVSSKKTNTILRNVASSIINKRENNQYSYLVYQDNLIAKPVIKAQTIEYKNAPLIYIYNTHDGEAYDPTGFENYNLDANVVTASYILQEQLKLYDIPSIVEEKSATSLVKKNGLSYEYTYEYSRQFLLNAIEQYPSIKIFIDLHRDGVSKTVSTTKINNKSYAKLMFFLGMGHENSNKNMELVKSLEQYLNENYNGLLRNTFIRPNDSYNQDINTGAFLIEVGGGYNTLDEVYNSLEAFAKALSNYLEESV